MESSGFASASEERSCQNDDVALLYNRILRLAAVKEQCTFDLRKRFLKDGCKETVIDEALRRAIEHHVVDDQRYTEQFIRCRLNQGRGRSGIESDLLNKELSIPEGFPWDEYACDDELQRALAYLERHPSRAKNARQGSYRKLVQKGFSSHIAAEAARTISV